MERPGVLSECSGLLSECSGVLWSALGYSRNDPGRIRRTLFFRGFLALFSIVERIVER